MEKQPWMTVGEQPEDRYVFRVPKGPHRWRFLMRRGENSLERWEG